MKVLVTGSAGFLGRRVVAELERRGHDVDGLDTAVETGDVRDLLWVPAWPGEYGLVVHCAAGVGGRTGIDGHPPGHADNPPIDAALFAGAATARPGRILHLSSSAVYPVRLQGAIARPLREDDVDLSDPRMPDQMYGWAKLTAELQVPHLREQGVPVTVVRPFSGYGPGQDLSYPLAAMIARARRLEDPFDVWGPGHQMRDFVHADDIVRASLKAC